MQAEGREQQSPSLMEPHRYLRLNDLAAAIRQARYPCEKVRTYSSVEQNGGPTSVYKVDCLEYSYRLTVTNGRSRIERCGLMSAFHPLRTLAECPRPTRDSS